MPSCIVLGCRSSSPADENIKFYRVPTVTNHRFAVLKNELTKRRRKEWLAAINRNDLQSPNLNQRVCEKHFLTGKPAAIEDDKNPDWVPSQNMGLDPKNMRNNVDRSETLDEWNKLKQTVGYFSDHNYTNGAYLQFDFLQKRACIKEERATGISTQTDLLMTDLDDMVESLNAAGTEIQNLQKKIESCPFGLMDNQSNVEMWKYYTGFEYQFVSEIFSIIRKHVPYKTSTALSSFNQLLLTLIKLRLNFDFKDLAYRSKISAPTASKYFLIMIATLYERLKAFIIWPELSNNNVPAFFKQAFREKTTVILDCFEVFIEKPDCVVTQQQCWSNDKQHHTVKFLIGVTPQGTICFISEAWGGSASDKEIIILSKFCDKISPGDIVLANKGFLIKDTVEIKQGKVSIPAFTKRNNQLHPLELEETRHMPQVTMHVERIIGLITSKFRILKGTIPISIIKMGNNNQLNTVDKIVTICCAFINLSPPIIPL